MSDQIPAVVKSDLSWVSSHLILLLVVAGIVAGGVFEVDSLLAKRADAEAARWQTVLAKQQQFSQDLIQKAAEQATQLTAVNSSLLASNQKLAANISARDQQTSQQIQKDSSLSASELSVHIADITKGIVSVQADNVILDLLTARTVAEKLDLLPSVQADLAETQMQLSQEKNIATNLQTELSTSQQIIVQDAITLADTVKSDQAELKKVKADARKSKIKVFGIGFVFGFLAREAIHFPTL